MLSALVVFGGSGGCQCAQKVDGVLKMHLLHLKGSSATWLSGCDKNKVNQEQTIVFRPCNNLEEGCELLRGMLLLLGSEREGAGFWTCLAICTAKLC